MDNARLNQRTQRGFMSGLKLVQFPFRRDAPLRLQSVIKTDQPENKSPSLILYGWIQVLEDVLCLRCIGMHSTFPVDGEVAVSVGLVCLRRKANENICTVRWEGS